MVVYKYYVDENYFEEINTPEKAYWLGFLYADGYIKNPPSDKNYKAVVLSLCYEDVQHIQKFKDTLKADHPIVILDRNRILEHVGIPKVYKEARITINNDALFDSLIKHGVICNKTYIHEFPTNVPDEFMSNYILGVFDGDGCITGKNRDIMVDIAGNYKFCKWIETKIKENTTIKGGGVSIHGTSYKWRLGGRNQVLKFCEYIYANKLHCLERKYNRYLEEINTVREYKGGPKLNEEQWCNVVERLIKGDKVSDIAKDFNISNAAVYKIKNKYCKYEEVMNE